MKKLIVILTLLVFPLFANAGVSVSSGGGGGTTITFDTVANLPGAPAAGDLAGVTNGSTASDCTSGGGSTYNVCVYNGSAWETVTSST